MVKRGAKDKWVVTEIGRKDWEVPKIAEERKESGEQTAEERLAKIPQETLEYLSEVKLDEKGVAIKSISRPPRQERLGRIVAATTDWQGRLFVLDEQTYCLHVFNPEGKKLFISKTYPSDANVDIIEFPSITIAHNGEILVKRPNKSGYIRFSPTGKRLGIERLDLDWVIEEWYCLPGINHRWVRCCKDIYLVDAKDKVLKTIKRRGNNTWLQNPGALTIGLDGSFIVIDAPDSILSGNCDWPSINLYSATGKPTRTFFTATSDLYGLAYNGRLIAAIGYDGPLFLYDTSGKALLRCEMGKYLKDNRGRDLFFSPDGKELRILDYKTKTLHRFALPICG